MSHIPKEIRFRVAARLYAEASDLGWEALSDQEKTEHYERWAQDPEIVKALVPYRDVVGIRVWIKDTPMKEYDRALERYGPYRDCTKWQYAGPRELLQKVGLDDWRVLNGSVGEKPMHMIACKGPEQLYVCWGKSEKFKDLLWAALSESLVLPVKPLIIVTSVQGEEIPDDVLVQQRALAARCDLDLAYVERSLVRTEPSLPAALF